MSVTFMKVRLPCGRWFALKTACRVAYRAFRKVYGSVRTLNMATGDKLTVNYTAEIT